MQYLIGGAIMGVGTATLIYLAPSTLINRWFKKRAGFFLGIVMACTGIGGVVWSTVGGILIQEVGWAWTYRIFALIIVALIPVFAVCIVSDPARKGLRPYGADEVEGLATGQADGDGDGSGSAATSAAQGTYVKAAQAFKMPEFYLIFAACFCLSFGMYLNSMIPSYLSTLAIGAAIPLLGAFATSTSMASQTISKLVLGFVGDKQPYVGAIIGAACGLLGIALLVAGAGSAAIVLVGAFAFGLYYGVVNVMMPILTRRCFGDGEYPIIYSRVSVAATVSGVVSGLLWGTLIEVFDSYSVMFVGVSLFIVVAIVSMAGVAIIQRKRNA